MAKDTATKQKRAVGYLRVSGKGQIDGDGFPRQRAAITAYAKSHDIRLMQVYEEKGVTGGKETMDRPAFVEMMVALHADGVKIILIEKLDRLARDLMVQEACIADLRKNGFELISVQEPDLMATDATRVLLRQLLGAVAQYEKTQIVIKLRGARQRAKAMTGTCEGRKPFGFTGAEQVTLEYMRTLRANDKTYEAIADTLNREGYVPRKLGTKFHPGFVHRLLTRS